MQQYMSELFWKFQETESKANEKGQIKPPIMNEAKTVAIKEHGEIDRILSTRQLFLYIYLEPTFSE